MEQIGEQAGDQRGSSAELLSVSCGHCGAPLQVPAGVQFLSCSYCGSRLELHRGSGAVYTQVLDAIDQRTQRIEQDVADIKARERLEQIDREWMIQRGSFMKRSKDGSESEPSTVGAIFGAIVTIGFGVFFAIGSANSGAPALFPFVGCVFVVFGIFIGIYGTNQASAYAKAHERYQSRRRQALDEISSAGR